ncbi:MAG: ATP-binding protein, partial [Candidatus Limnocylindrales bacterium]
MAFVGREPELARLAGALERAARGERSSIALVGSAGVGLTRLLDEVVGRLADLPDLTIVRGAAHEPRAGEPYATLGDGLRTLIAHVADDRLPQVVGPAGPILAPLVPELADRLARHGVGPLKAPLVASPEQAGGRFVEAVVGLLERLAGVGTILLILEDLHWADPGSRQFIDTLLRIGRPARLCLVMTYRPEELHLHHPVWDFAQTIARDPAIQTVEVRPLDREDAVRLLEVLLGERPSAAFVAAAMEGSGGNPLRIEQLAVARQGGPRVRLSEPFAEIVRARLEPLSVGATRCLHLLAAARRPLPVGLIRRLELPAGRLPQDAIEEALASGLARIFDPTGGRSPRRGRGGKSNGLGDRRSGPTPLRGGQLVGLPHEQYAEALGSLGLPSEWQPLHAVLARALTGHPAEQAWHLEKAIRFAAARNAHLEAGLAAEAIEPGPTALSHFRRVLELVDAREPRVPSLSMSLRELLARSAEAAFASNESRRAAGLLEQAISEATAVRRLERAAPAGDRRRALEGEVGQRYVRLGQF